MIDCENWLNGCDRIFLIRKERSQKEVGGSSREGVATILVKVLMGKVNILGSSWLKLNVCMVFRTINFKPARAFIRKINMCRFNFLICKYNLH